MALLERVGTLLRANVNDLIDRAEDPEKMVKQVILDMENQLMQVKTQLAITIADLHLLERRKKENLQTHDRVDAEGGTGGRQEAGRSGAARHRAVAGEPQDRGELRRTDRRSEGAGRTI